MINSEREYVNDISIISPIHKFIADQSCDCALCITHSFVGELLYTLGSHDLRHIIDQIEYSPIIDPWISPYIYDLYLPTNVD